ncbi:MAG: hypothetical protein R3F14_12925 [Polyangiaceae bacterium]
MGTAWASDVAEQASKEITSSGPLTLRADGSPRVKSGVFFAIARRAAYDLVMKGTLNRRDFYSTFCWRERKPREPKPVLPQRRPKEAAQRPAFSAKPKQQQGANAPRRKAPPPAEVYSFRRPVR